MTKEQELILDKKFTELERKATRIVLIVLTIIVFIHIYFAKASFAEIFVEITFSLCLSTVFGFLFASWLKVFFYPIWAKRVFKS